MRVSGKEEAPWESQLAPGLCAGRVCQGKGHSSKCLGQLMETGYWMRCTFCRPVLPGLARSVLVVHVMKFLRCGQSSVTARSPKAVAVWAWNNRCFGLICSSWGSVLQQGVGALFPRCFHSPYPETFILPGPDSAVRWFWLSLSGCLYVTSNTQPV